MNRLTETKILSLDNEQSALNILNRAITEILPDAELRSFNRASAALKELEVNGYRPDVAFLDIEMPGMTGLELAGRSKISSPETWIVFVTGYSNYALEAFSVHAGGYLLKPVSSDMIRAELENAAIRLPAETPVSKNLRVQCFGNFDVFMGEKELLFKRKKSKELFAYLIHRRGSACSTRELAAVLFGDVPYDRTQQSYMQTIVSDLCRTFASCGYRNVLIKDYGTMAVNTSLVDCDYYKFLELDPAAVNSYTGEYMEQYEWASFTTGFLDETKMKS